MTYWSKDDARVGETSLLAFLVNSHGAQPSDAMESKFFYLSLASPAVSHPVRLAHMPSPVTDTEIALTPGGPAVARKKGQNDPTAPNVLRTAGLSSIHTENFVDS